MPQPDWQFKLHYVLTLLPAIVLAAGISPWLGLLWSVLHTMLNMVLFKGIKRQRVIYGEDVKNYRKVMDLPPG